MLIIKIGGGESLNLEGIVKDLTQVKEPYILVHGANALRDELARKLGIEKRVVTSLSGYSSVFSDGQAIDLLMLAYAGLKNKRLVELCQIHGINAVGLSGLDGRIIQGERNKGIKVKEGEKTLVLRDFSGKPRSINTQLLQHLLANGYTPVLSMPIIDENGFAINSENDDVVTVLTQSLSAKSVISLIEAPGFLEDTKDPNSLVKEICSEELLVREEQVENRMKRKILALRKLFESGAAKVIISDGRVEHPLLDALNGAGTVIIK